MSLDFVFGGVLDLDSVAWLSGPLCSVIVAV
jgi:hypothetical protein